ncbi:MAG: tRNA pseudouridine(13) synthase TruD [Clostridiales bacterium]|nr:tRNA pseudouridine(13) synthase TruD [Clostridiales bacterium]
MIKAKPEDFVVEERANLRLQPRGQHRVYLLKKSHWNTLDLIRFLSHSLSLPLDKFSYGGKKDRHGLTHQFIAIQDQADFSREGKDFALESRGFMDRPMSPDLITGNAFTVTIRDFEDLIPVEKNVEEVKKTGFPNFFDDQRFRSYDPERGFFAEKILRRHWNGALQVFLTSTGAEDGKKERERREAIYRDWKNWRACLDHAINPLEKKIFSFLNNHPKGFFRALHLIPAEEVSMFFSAFQSHLWNEVLRRVIKLKIGDVEEIMGTEGSYLFWTKLDEDLLSYLNSLEIPTAAVKTDFSDAFTRSLNEEILREKNLQPSFFRTKALRKVYFRSFRRKALLIPDDLRVIAEGEDEFHPDRKKLTLSFFLPRGAYGTMLIKRISLET